MYFGRDGDCYSHDWGEGMHNDEPWDGMEGFSGSCKIGMLLDLDEGTLSVYKKWKKVGCNEKGIGRPLLLGCINVTK